MAIAIAALMAVWPTTAHAEENDETPQAAEGPVVAAPDVRSPQPDTKRFVVSVEGLGVLSNRYGVSFEAVLTARDTLTFYPWFVVGESTGTHDLFGDYQGGGPNDYTDYDVQTRAGGLDLQYRRYLGSSVGAQGVFMAPGFEVAHYITNGTACSYTGDPQVGTCGPEPRQEWTYLAPSLDVGGQAVLPVGLTVGASLGAHYRVVVGSLDDSIMPWGWRVSHGPGAEPRLRVWVGWAF